MEAKDYKRKIEVIKEELFFHTELINNLRGLSRVLRREALMQYLQDFMKESDLYCHFQGVWEPQKVESIEIVEGRLACKSGDRVERVACDELFIKDDDRFINFKWDNILDYGLDMNYLVCAYR